MGDFLRKAYDDAEKEKAKNKETTMIIPDSERSAVMDVQRIINGMRRGEVRITVSGIQRELRCSFGYASAIMAHLEMCGIVSAPDKDGVRSLINKGK